MSAELYMHRLYWDGRRGCAKCDEVTIELHGAPNIGIKHLSEIDYAPEVRVAMVREMADRWRDLTKDEMRVADEMLQRVKAAALGALQ